MLVDGEVVGPNGSMMLSLVVDTGAAATTLTPEIVHEIGYSPLDGFRRAGVQTATGFEPGYWLHVAKLTVLDVAVPDFAVMVCPLHRIDGLVGMNFLRHFNLLVRYADRDIDLGIFDPVASITG